MVPVIPRKNSRQWRTIIFLICAEPAKWWNDSGDGHLQFLDDVSRLRDKGWPIEARDNEDGYSKSYRMDRQAWNKIEGTVQRFW